MNLNGPECLLSALNGSSSKRVDTALNNFKRIKRSKTAVNTSKRLYTAYGPKRL